MNRRLFLAASALPLLALGACGAPVTQSLYSEASRSEYKDYSERVSQILITNDGKKIVVVGPTYHYIIDTPPRLVEVLNSPLHPDVVARMGQFNVTPDAKLSGSFTLNLSDKAGDQSQQLAQSFGFSKASGGRMTLSFNLSGTRYSAKEFTMPSALAKQFNQSYSVDIREELPPGGKSALVLLTPLTVAADGVLNILAIPLVPLGVAGLVAASAMR